eukprot:416454_1
MYYIVAEICSCDNMAHIGDDEKKQESKTCDYSLTISSIQDKLCIHLLDVNSKQMYQGLFTSTELQKCGFNKKQASNFDVIANFMQTAKKMNKVYTLLSHSIKTNNKMMKVD